MLSQRLAPLLLALQNCGVVVEAHVIDERSEWRTFADKDGNGADPNRVGGPVNPLLSDGGMSTMIGGGKGVDHALVSWRCCVPATHMHRALGQPSHLVRRPEWLINKRLAASA
jgi:hypothetical protein